MGTSIALGSIADRAIKATMYLGVAGIMIGFLKLIILKRFAGIPFRKITIASLTVIIAYNYLSPAFMAGTVTINPTDESARRNLWLLFYLLMLISFLVIWVDAVRQKKIAEKKPPFLQSPVMAYLFALIVLFGSGVHQYTMAYAFTLERVILDYAPAVAVGCLLLIEVLRLSGKQNIAIDVGIASIPGVMTLYAIHDQSVLSSGQWGFGLLCYPPVILACMGAAVTGLAIYRKAYGLYSIVAVYGLGVIWTIGFSPEYPHELNTMVCGIVLITALLVYGLFIRNPYICLSAVVLVCICLSAMDWFSELTKNWQLTELGALAGIFGLGALLLYLIFVKNLHLAVRIFGAILLAAFIYDFLPASLNTRYLILRIVLGLFGTILWIRTKDFLVVSILTIPVFIRIYILTKILASWRHIILGFVALLTGAWISISKRTVRDRACTENKDNPGPD